MDAVRSLAILAAIGIAVWLLLSVTVRWLAQRADADNAAADEQRRMESAQRSDWRTRMDAAEQAAIQGMTHDELVTAAGQDPDVGFAALDALKVWSFDRDAAGEALGASTRASREVALETVRNLRRAHPGWARSLDDQRISSIVAERQSERNREDAERHSAQLAAEEQAAERLGITVAEYRQRLVVEHIGWWSARQRRR